MNILANYELTDHQELNSPLLLEAVKHMCEFDEIIEPFLIVIDAKSFSYKNRTITYTINIIDLNDAP